MHADVQIMINVNFVFRNLISCQWRCSKQCW